MFFKVFLWIVTVHFLSETYLNNTEALAVCVSSDRCRSVTHVTIMAIWFLRISSTVTDLKMCIRLLSL